MGHCTECVHYRRRVSRSALLREEIETMTEPMEKTLAEIADEQTKRRDAEAQQRVMAMSRGDQIWETRPHEFEYCGEEESSGVYYIADVRNAELRCDHFTQGPAPAHRCATCTERVAPFGYTRDAKKSTALSAASVYVPSTTERANSERGAMEQRAASEIEHAYRNDGRSDQQWEYLGICKVYSRVGELYIAGVLHNAVDSCPQWKPNQIVRGESVILEVIHDARPVRHGNYQFEFTHPVLTVQAPNPSFGAPLTIKYRVDANVEAAPRMLLGPDEMPLPLLLRTQNMTAFIKVLKEPLAGVATLAPFDERPRTFIARKDQYYYHPSEDLGFCVSVSDTMLTIHGKYGGADSFDMTKLPPGEWMQPSGRSIQYPLKVRLDPFKARWGVFMPEVEWLG